MPLNIMLTFGIEIFIIPKNKRNSKIPHIFFCYTFEKSQTDVMATKLFYLYVTATEILRILVTNGGFCHKL